MRNSNVIWRRFLALILACLFALEIVPSGVSAVPLDDVAEAGVHVQNITEAAELHVVTDAETVPQTVEMPDEEQPLTVVGKPVLSSNIEKDILASQELEFTVTLSNKEALAGQKVTGEISFVGSGKPIVYYHDGQNWKKVENNQFENIHEPKEQYRFKVKFPEDRQTERTYVMKVSLKETSNSAELVSYTSQSLTVYDKCTIRVTVIPPLGGTLGGKVEIDGKVRTEYDATRFPVKVRLIPDKAYKVGSYTIIPSGLNKSDTSENTVEIQINSFSQSKMLVQFVRKVSVNEFRFANPTPTTAYKNDGQYQQEAISDPSGGRITYEIETQEPQNAAVMKDETKGILSINKPGKVTVKAVRQEDRDHLEAIARYTLHIEKGNQTVEFENREVSLYYGERAEINPVKVSTGSSVGALTYHITGENKIGAHIDPHSGQVTFSDKHKGNKTGSVTIKVVKPEDDYYKEASDEYTLTVKFLETKARARITGLTQNESGWYVGNVKLIAPEGYKISRDNRLDSAAWSDNIDYTVEGINTERYFLRQNKTGAITDILETEDIKLDTTKPKLELNYLNKNVINQKNGIDIYREDPIAVITITEEYFAEKDVQVKVQAADINGNEIPNINVLQSWKHSGNKHELTLTFRDDAIYTFDVTCNDIAGNQGEKSFTEQTFILDRTPPQIEKITYDEPSIWSRFLSTVTMNFFKEKVRVRITARDDISGVDRFQIVYTKAADASDVDADSFVGEQWPAIQNSPDKSVFTTEYLVDGNLKGTFSVRAVDWAQNDTEKNSETIVVDSINPQMYVSVKGVPAAMVRGAENDRVDTADADTRFIYNEPVQIDLRIEEANFSPDDVKIQVKRDGKEVTDYRSSDWKKESKGIFSKPIFLEMEGDYVVNVYYQDRSQNDLIWESDEYSGKSGEGIYKSNVITLDQTPPTLGIEFVSGSKVGKNTFDGDVAARIIVTERNFHPDDIKLSIQAKNAFGRDVQIENPTLANWDNWEKEQDKWVAELSFTVDAKYDLTLSYKDLAGFRAVPVHEAFVVDQRAPVDTSVTYSKGLFETVVEKITFGYYNADVRVTLTATDEVSGVESFTVDVLTEGSAGATNIELPQNLVIWADGTVTGEAGDIRDIRVNSEGGTTTAEFKIPTQFRGAVSFIAKDQAHHSSDRVAKDQIIVVDSIAPSRTVTYEPDRVVDRNMKDVESFTEEDQVVLYYNEDAVVKFQITEANFYGADMVVKVNGVKQRITEWKNTADDQWEGVLTLDKEGDYIVTAEYMDRSKNEMRYYTSPRIVVDKTVPVIQIEYGNQNVVRHVNGRDYYNTTQTATVTIREHNFRPEDVKLEVTAQNLMGQNVMTVNEDGLVESYARKGAAQTSWTLFEKGTWRRVDDTYVMELVFDTDANYTVDVQYDDLAYNAAADYKKDVFTVDQTPPENLSITYSAGVFSKIMEAVTFGFYNAPVKVTITAQDDITGIEHFEYSYENAPNVSKINAEILNAEIQQDQISYDGSRATAVFKIPARLSADKQFNGTVRFAAFDVSTNVREHQDGNRLVVDNIEPTANISFNSPQREENGISYYNEDIVGTMIINEANFYSEDVQLQVSRNGEHIPVNVIWKKDTSDIHRGTFTLSQEGDYIVSVQYRDKSNNQMRDYVSNQLTLDKSVPTIRVENIKANSAVKQEKFGFEITFEDVNLDITTAKAVLTVVRRGENGLFVTEEISLGDPYVTNSGQTYRYVVENLQYDGVYKLSSSVKDLSGNTSIQMLLDNGELYEEVRFSVNRDGSTFDFGNQYTEKLVNQYYVYCVYENLAIEEINVDPIEQYSIFVNGRKLNEGVDFTTFQTTSPDEWSKRTYVINKSLFEGEGEYNIVIASVDKTETTAYSDIKNLRVAFVVDQTKPVVTISGLEKGGRYRTAEQMVTLIPSDEGGRLRSLQVLIFDENGKPKMDQSGQDISVRFSMEGDAFLKYLEEHNGVVTFTIPEGFQNRVQIICNDYAINDQGRTNEYNESFDQITVSDSDVVIFYANKPLFYGTIGGVALVSIFFFLLFWKRRKESDDEDEQAESDS